MEDRKQQIIRQTQKILSEAFSHFYKKDDFEITPHNEKSDERTDYQTINFRNMPEIENSLKISIHKDSPSKFFSSFLLDGFHQECWNRYFDLPEDNEIKKYGDRIYQKALILFEQYIYDILQINLTDIIAISASYQEGEIANGNIYFLFDDSENIKFRFLNYIDVKEVQAIIPREVEKITLCNKDIRKIRKFIEIARETEFAEALEPVFLYDGNWKLEGFYSGVIQKSYIKFHFTGHMVWEMYWNTNAIIRYNCGKFENPLPSYKKQFKIKINQLLTINSDDCDFLIDIIQAATKQRHGTTLIILCEEEKTVREEVNNLYLNSSGQVIKTEPVTADNVRRLTSIDGALMLDNKGRCYGYGMILTVKGEKRVKKDSGRGARFNSAKLYIAEKTYENRKAIAVIVSEDGMINIYSTNDAKEEMNTANENRQ